jgi:predicted ArsR family transcriptional regulator
MNPMDMFKKKFDDYKQIVAVEGPQEAHDFLMKGYAERQKKSLGPYIENNSLYEGFKKAIPVYAQLGMVMDAVDISNKDMDAVIEVHRVCPFMDMAKEYGFEKPCPIICDLDIEATIEAFDGFKGKTISCQADGDCVCIFQYERPMKK